MSEEHVMTPPMVLPRTGRDAGWSAAAGWPPEFLDAISDAVIVTDTTGKVIAWNRGAEALYGWTAQEAIGIPILDLTVAPNVAIPAADVLERLAHGESWSGSYLVRNKSGAVFVASVDDMPILDAEGRVVAFVGVSRSIEVPDPGGSSGPELAAARGAIEEAPDAVHLLHSTLVRPDFPAVDGVSLAAVHLAAYNSYGLSGDWYDAFLGPDGQLIVAVGDVTGHGLDATRFMAKVRHATRAYAALGFGLAEILIALDRFVEHFSTNDLLVTAQLAVLDPDLHRITLANAGHPPPVLVTEDAARVVDPAPASILGLGGHDGDSVRELDWFPGHTLVMYSDGLVERRHEHIDTGIGRLTEALRRAPRDAHDLQDAAIAACLGSVVRHDDACILVARHNSEPE